MKFGGSLVVIRIKNSIKSNCMIDYTKRINCTLRGKKNKKGKKQNMTYIQDWLRNFYLDKY